MHFEMFKVAVETGDSREFDSVLCKIEEVSRSNNNFQYPYAELEQAMVSIAEKIRTTYTPLNPIQGDIFRIKIFVGGTSADWNPYFMVSKAYNNMLDLTDAYQLWYYLRNEIMPEVQRQMDLLQEGE